MQAAAAAVLLALVCSAQASSLLVLATDRNGKPLADAVVTVHVPGAAVQAALKPALMVQEDFAFNPYVLVIPVGTQVSFPNRDRVSHHLRSSSKEYDFEFPIYEPRRSTTPLRFDRTGTVQLNCHIHNSMRAYIRVVDTPFFAVTDAHGTARLEGLPTGTFEVRGWHPDLIIDVPATKVALGSQAVNLPMAFPLTPQPKPQPRARPIPGAAPSSLPGYTY